MRNNNKGAVLPLVAIMLAFIVVCVALAVDLGHMHSMKIQLQRAVDAAALAAAKELNGGSEQNDKAISAAESLLKLNKKLPQTSSMSIELGDWDENALEKANYQRFRPTNVNPDSAKVTASMEIDPIFNIFGDKSTIRADAIADNISKPIVIPLAVVSCVPTGADDIMTPGEDICDLSLLLFNNDKKDNAGWTSLTITPASGISPTYFTNPDPLLSLRAIDLFNRIVYGNDEQLGLETAPVKTGSPCETADNVTPYSQIDPVFLTGENEVSCGLGNENELGHLPRWYDTEEILEIATQQGLEAAGYPKIEATNGVTNVVEALKGISVGIYKNNEQPSTFKKSLSAEYQPFDSDEFSLAKGKTILLTLPVIWSTDCSDSFSKDLFYVGTANFLMTRLWETPQQCYDFGEDSLHISEFFDNTSTCTDRLDENNEFFGGVLPNWTARKLTQTTGFATKTIEGILLDPTKYPQKDEIKRGINRLVIVE